MKDADWMVTVPVMRIWVEANAGLREAWVGLIYRASGCRGPVKRRHKNLVISVIAVTSCP